MRVNFEHLLAKLPIVCCDRGERPVSV